MEHTAEDWAPGIFPSLARISSRRAAVDLVDFVSYIAVTFCALDTRTN